MTLKNIKEAVNLRIKGHNPQEIATKLGYTHSTIQSALSDYAVANDVSFPKLIHKNLKWTPEIVKEWRDLVRQGWTRKEIAQKYKLNPGTVIQKLNAEVQS